MQAWILLSVAVGFAAVTCGSAENDFDLDNFLMTEIDVDQTYVSDYRYAASDDSDSSDSSHSEDSDSSHSEDSDSDSDSHGRGRHHGHRPRPCCTPEQMECHVSSIIASKSGKSAPSLVAVYMPRLAVDYRRGMLGLREMVFYDKKVTNVSTIVNFKTGVGYVITGKDKQQCRKFRAPKAMADHCIPDKARYGGSLWLGAGRGAMVCDRWIVRGQPKPGVNVTAVVLVQRETCTGVNVVEHVTNNGTSAISSTHYYDVTLRIRDPSIFRVPSICNKVPLLDNLELSDTAAGVLDRLSA